MKLICILMALSSLALMLGLVVTALIEADDSESGGAADGVDAGAAGATQ